MKVLTRTCGLLGRGSASESANKLGLAFLIVATFLVSSISCKKYNVTSAAVFKSDPDHGTGASIAKNVITSTAVNESVPADSSSAASSFTVGTSRQARDYNPGGGSGGNSYSVPVGGGGSAASSYGAPSVGGGGGGGGGYGSVAAGGGYPNPQYAIPPIVLVLRKTL